MELKYLEPPYHPTWGIPLGNPIHGIEIELRGFSTLFLPFKNPIHGIEMTESECYNKLLQWANPIHGIEMVNVRPPRYFTYPEILNPIHGIEMRV